MREIIKPKNNYIDGNYIIEVYIKTPDSILAVVRGKGKVVLWEGDDVIDHLSDDEGTLYNQVIYQLFKID